MTFQDPAALLYYSIYALSKVPRALRAKTKHQYLPNFIIDIPNLEKALVKAFETVLSFANLADMKNLSSFTRIGLTPVPEFN